MNYRRAFLFGLGVWAAPFVVAIAIFSLRESERPLFESIMAVALAATTVVFAHLYLKGGRSTGARGGLALGVVWLVISVVIDLLMFSWGPMKMALSDYVKDIAVTYLLIPAITTGMAVASQR